MQTCTLYHSRLETTSGVTTNSGPPAKAAKHMVILIGPPSQRSNFTKVEV